jgi:hypothetical protein
MNAVEAEIRSASRASIITSSQITELVDDVETHVVEPVEDIVVEDEPTTTIGSFQTADSQTQHMGDEINPFSPQDPFADAESIAVDYVSSTGGMYAMSTVILTSHAYWTY